MSTVAASPHRLVEDIPAHVRLLDAGRSRRRWARSRLLVVEHDGTVTATVATGGGEVVWTGVIPDPPASWPANGTVTAAGDGGTIDWSRACSCGLSTALRRAGWETLTAGTI